MRFLKLAAFALAISVSAHAQTTPPTPSLTAGAELKGLRFDWEPVAGASWYVLEYKANQNASFVQKGSDLPASATSYSYRFPLHLFDWTYARYRLAACNASGCSRSAEVSVSNLRRDAVGYFKAATPARWQQFGIDTDISPDGLNFVVATNLEGDAADSNGAAYVFRRGSNGEWLQRARLVPPQPAVFNEDSQVKNVSISADGNTVVVGMPDYFPYVIDEEAYDEISGEVFVFHFNGTTWARSRLPSGARGSFGRWISISDAGDLIAVSRGESFDPAKPRHVVLYRNINGSWQAVRSFPAVYPTFCDTHALSADGSTLVQSCILRSSSNAPLRTYLRTWSGSNWTVREDIPLEFAGSNGIALPGAGLAVDGTGSTIAVQTTDENGGTVEGTEMLQVQVFHRDGAYSKVAALSPGPWRNDYWRSLYGNRIALSDDGGTLAVADPYDNGAGTGPRAAPLNPTTTNNGAIYIYRLRNNWLLANMVKGNTNTAGSLGEEVALNANGQTLIVGSNAESSTAQGIGGDWTEGYSQASGAVWMY